MADQVFPKTGGRINILLVEDDPVAQRIVTRSLENVTCEVDIAGDGVEAIDKLLEKDFDLVLMDIRLPNLDGFELIRHIREKEESTQKHLPIVAMTGSALPTDYDRAMEAGADTYIIKPVLPEMITEIVRQHGPKRTS
ncbi:MAG: response regulator [Deltaproteobacteria bacterium]|nr:response regulator [Deltaproteobacteria bacterium]